MLKLSDRCLKFELKGTRFDEHKRLEGTYALANDPRCTYRYNNVDRNVQDVLFAWNDRLFDNDHAVGSEACNNNR